jgi:hypothetical protein
MKLDFELHICVSTLLLSAFIHTFRGHIHVVIIIIITITITIIIIIIIIIGKDTISFM